MSDTLRDQLLGLGFKPAPKPEQKKPAPKPPRNPGRRPEGQARDQNRRPQGGQDRPDARRGPRPVPAQRSREEIDLAKAYAIRAQKEKDERIEAERIKQEEARVRREAKARLADLLKDKALNDPAADIARHFDYGGKIKRIYVNAAQLKSLNAGELGVVQLDGRYLLVDAEVLAQAEATFAPAVALRVDPSAPTADDPYADAQFQVPDDLVW